jgi:hypothetical protein
MSEQQLRKLLAMREAPLPPLSPAAKLKLARAAARDENNRSPPPLASSLVSICNQCGAVFPSTASLQQHIDDKHGSVALDRPLQCQYCGSYFVRASDLAQHSYEKHEQTVPARGHRGSATAAAAAISTVGDPQGNPTTSDWMNLSDNTTSNSSARNSLSVAGAVLCTPVNTGSVPGLRPVGMTLSPSNPNPVTTAQYNPLPVCLVSQAMPNTASGVSDGVAVSTGTGLDLNTTSPAGYGGSICASACAPTWYSGTDFSNSHTVSDAFGTYSAPFPVQVMTTEENRLRIDRRDLDYLAQRIAAELSGEFKKLGLTATPGK